MNSASSHYFFQGGGEMGKLMRSTAWSETAIGNVENWPTSLKLACSIMLSSPFPMYIAWGKEFIQMYNDGYRPILGATKHPKAMGNSTRETFKEIWQIIGPMFEAVMRGEAVGFPNFKLPLDRNGYIEECYFDFSYSPIHNEDGSVGGVLVTVIEVTETVNAFRSLEESEKQLKLSQAKTLHQRDQLKEFFMQAPAGICILDGRDLVFDLVNPRYQQLMPSRSLLNRPIFEALPELIGTPLQDTLLKVFNTGESFQIDELLIPISITEGGPTVDRYFTFNYQARRNEHNVVDGILVFVFEVTAMVEARQHQLANNEELQNANEDLAEINAQLLASNQELNEIKNYLEISESRFRFMLNAIPQQVWTARPDGQLDYVNQVVCNDFGYTTEHIVGHGWQAFIHPDDLSNCLEKWAKALSDGTEYFVEFRLKFRDGTYRWHLSRAKPFLEDKDIKLWLGTNTNIDVHKVNELQKDEFLSIASHELRTPLTSIKLYNQLLQRNDDPIKLKPFILKSADHIRRLERLITDLLDVTKINAGKMNYVMEPVNIKSLIEDSIETMQQSITSHQIVLEEAPDVELNGDLARLDQVLHNLLSNAVKYSPNATKIIVHARVDQDNIIVSVQDFGVGIPSENLDKLFDRYYRVDNTATRFDGLGLGLYISAEILRRHGGSFWIESEYGKGSTFFFRLPLERTEKKVFARSRTFYHDERLKINFNPAKRRLEVDWTGFQDMESVKHGCMLMLQYLKENKCDRVVNDNTHVEGNWSEATDWVGNVWFPMMENAGLKYFAHVFSPSTFSKLSAIKSIDIMAGLITTQYFTNVKLAEEWIEGLPA